MLTDRLAVNIRFFMPSIGTDVRYDASNGTPGTLLTGEGTLGLEDKLKQGSIDLQFRMLERHRIRAQFYKQTRTGDVVLNQQITSYTEYWPMVLGIILLVWADLAFDRLLITKVRSDLAVANGYFESVLGEVGASAAAVAESHALQLALARPASGELVTLLQRFKAREADRRHVEDSIRQGRHDVDISTERKGSPHVLVCTKNQASYERRVAQRRADLDDMTRLKA